MLRKLRSVSTLHKNTSDVFILCRYDKKLLQYKSSVNTLDLRLYSLSSNVPSFDVAIVGCGLVGLSTAMQLKERLPALSMVAIDKEPYVAAHQSTNNSGVIHAGIYYKPGSLRAKLCVEGMYLMYEYCDKYNIPYKKNGKLIVAVTPQEVKWMENLLKIGNANNVPGLEIYDLKQIQEIEPYCVGIKALWSPWTGIIEFGAVARHMASRFRELGGKIVLNYPVTSFESTAEGCGTTKKDTSSYPVTIFSKDRMIKAGFVMTACGLQADRVAQMTGEGPMPKIVPFRGEYFKLSKEKEDRVTTNIYPVPDPSLPFIGVHFTPRLDGTILLGPTAMIAYKREGYKWNEVDMTDCLDLLKFKGIYIFATKYFKSCLYEVARSVSKKVMLKELQLYMPTLTINDLTPGAWAGVQAQAMNNDGTFTPDFNFSRVKGRIFHCRNTPSPGATSSIAIGKHLAEKIQKELQ